MEDIRDFLIDGLVTFRVQTIIASLNEVPDAVIREYLVHFHRSDQRVTLAEHAEEACLHEEYFV